MQFGYILFVLCFTTYSQACEKELLNLSTRSVHEKGIAHTSILFDDYNALSENEKLNTVGSTFAFSFPLKLWEREIPSIFYDLKKTEKGIDSRLGIFSIQEILEIKDFSAIEKSVIQYALKNSFQKKYLRRGIRREIKDKLKLFRNSKIKIPEEVEIGIWILTFKDGKKAVLPFTSGLANVIKHSEDALEGYFKNHNLNYSDCTQVQYFHNHPKEFPPLSVYDIYSMHKRHEIFSEASKKPIPIHYYAVSKLSGKIIVFHSSAL